MSLTQHVRVDLRFQAQNKRTDPSYKHSLLFSLINSEALQAQEIHFVLTETQCIVILAVFLFFYLKMSDSNEQRLLKNTNLLTVESWKIILV